MSKHKSHRIGQLAILLAVSEEPGIVEASILSSDYQSCIGRVGSMESNKIVAAIETAAKKNGFIREGVYREAHALYHAIIEALHGVTRGQVQLGSFQRTVGLRFTIVRGKPYKEEAEGEWIAVALYGTIGAPIKGQEHETIGLGINHI
ncbi:hut operon transcriptional regulator HutP [Halalkalibacterium halodurans]|uniref:hut operon transcriptional regulator HutP n=1 Tax=Halalkalibacterium halodurans TaxID=86665 RepID=UPI002E1FA42E|nr:hut operon transcriptional regulator HutP [Halalkalibacterium halodurans]